MASIKVTPQELRQIASTCKKEANTVRSVRQTVDSKIKGSNWDSPAATRFKSDWNGKFVKALNELNEALQELGKAADTMAKNYEEADAAYKSS